MSMAAVLNGCCVPNLGKHKGENMDKSFKKRWIAALRSGDYAQGTGSLVYSRTPRRTEFCCLGVACELAAQDGLLQRSIPNPEHPSPDREGYIDLTIDEGSGFYGIRENSTLPNVVVNLLGWADNNGAGDLPEAIGMATTLVGLNDGERWTFDQIADLLESDDF